MELSANDLRNYEFPTQMRGYDKEEVDSLLQQVASVLEQAQQEKLKLSMELESTRSELGGLREFENAIKNAAIDARRNADQTVETANKEAEQILQKAQQQAQEIVGTRSAQVDTLKEQIEKLTLSRKSYASKFRSLIKSHLEIVEEIDEEPVDSLETDSIKVEDSTDITSSRRESIADPPPTPEPIHVEEANAADAIVPAKPPEVSTPTVNKGVDTTQTDAQPGPSEGTPDPELVAALNSYTQPEAGQTPQGPPLDAINPDAVPETTEPAAKEKADIQPDIMVGKKIPPGLGLDTNLQQADATPSQKSPEHHQIDVDMPLAAEPKGAPSLGPDNIADELDKVVAKFEEEMDKADKS